MHPLIKVLLQRRELHPALLVWLAAWQLRGTAGSPTKLLTVATDLTSVTVNRAVRFLCCLGVVSLQAGKLQLAAELHPLTLALLQQIQTGAVVADLRDVPDRLVLAPEPADPGIWGLLKTVVTNYRYTNTDSGIVSANRDSVSAVTKTPVSTVTNTLSTSFGSFSPVIHDLLVYWQTRCDKQALQFTSNRRKAIYRVLAAGVSVPMCRDAIDWAATSPFHQGQNDRGKDYRDVLTIFRTPERVEQYAEQWRTRGSLQRKPVTDAREF
jgi:hypothetical protein